MHTDEFLIPLIDLFDFCVTKTPERWKEATSSSLHAALSWRKCRCRPLFRITSGARRRNYFLTDVTIRASAFVVALSDCVCIQSIGTKSPHVSLWIVANASNQFNDGIARSEACGSEKCCTATVYNGQELSFKAFFGSLVYCQTAL